LSDRIEKQIESKINSELAKKQKNKSLDDGFKKNKVINEVLDKSTVFELYDLIKSKIIAYVNGVVKAGKESVVFWAVDQNKSNVALKIYLVSTSNFKKRSEYLYGDPRFSRVKKGTRNLVYLWAKKEFQNILQCYRCGIPVVKPIHVSKNILVMEFIGNNGNPEKTLLESDVDENDYHQSIQLITDLFTKAKLVHADFSEYNIFKTKNGLKLFDLGSAIDLNHPKMMEFLKRDINNITNFFVKRGLTVENPVDIIARITK
jgi:RIO kinase 1|tara:strand:+ start:94 stop:873 length:780 start_codon:yes stop_codon:yes gene_type:complete